MQSLCYRRLYTRYQLSGEDTLLFYGKIKPQPIILFAKRKRKYNNDFFGISAVGILNKRKVFSIREILYVLKKEKEAHEVYRILNTILKRTVNNPSKSLGKICKIDAYNLRYFVESIGYFVESIVNYGEHYKEEIKNFLYSLKEYFIVDPSIFIDDPNKWINTFCIYETLVKIREYYYGSEYNYQITKKEIFNTLELFRVIMYKNSDVEYKKVIDFIISILEAVVESNFGKLKDNSGYQLYKLFKDARYGIMDSLFYIFSWLNEKLGGYCLDRIIGANMTPEEYKKILLNIKKAYKKMLKRNMKNFYKSHYFDEYYYELNSTFEYDAAISCKIEVKFKGDDNLIIESLRLFNSEGQTKVYLTSNLDCLRYFVGLLLAGENFGGGINKFKKNIMELKKNLKKIKEYNILSNKYIIHAVESMSSQSLYIAKRDHCISWFTYRTDNDSITIFFNYDVARDFISLFVGDEMAGYIYHILIECIRNVYEDVYGFSVE